jgi:LCP family protein required for cell wall assembly
VPRRPKTELDSSRSIETSRPEIRSSTASEEGRVLKHESDLEMDISQSLKQIDSGEPSHESRRARRRANKVKAQDRPHAKRRRIIKWVTVLLVVIVLGVLAFFGYKFISNTSKVFKGNIFGLTQHKKLQEDANGRTNILLFGTSEDDPGHDGGSLTDSIMILSVDQDAKNAYLFNIPRDLEVKYDKACLSEYSGKINALYQCYYDNGSNEQAGAEALMHKVGEVSGLQLQYYAHVNYTVVRDVVNSLGGIKVTIESRDPRGQMDSNFDWKCGPNYSQRKKVCPPNGHFIDYPNGEVELDAEHALYLAQARGDIAPTYGFEQSNYDREKNQQKIVVAIRDKALSAGTLTNLGKVTGLMDALGNNLRTNFQTEEVSTLMGLGKDIPADSIKTISLYDDKDSSTPLDGTGNPKAGKYQFAAIQAFIAKKISSDPVVKEEAPLMVLNGTNESGIAQKAADALESKKYTVISVGNAPDATYKPVEIYQIKDGYTGTTDALKKLYNVTTITKGAPAGINPGTAAFVIIIGSSSIVSGSAN